MFYDVANFGMSANPPGAHHRALAAEIAQQFDQLRIFPCGPNRAEPEKASLDYIQPVHRAALADLTFAGLGSKVIVDLWDLEQGNFTRTHDFGEMLRSRDLSGQYRSARIWHVVGADWIRGGSAGRSRIQSEWQHGEDIWKNLNWAVLSRPGYEICRQDLPPNCRVIQTSITGSSTNIRTLRVGGKPFEHLLVPAAAEYIGRYKLYTGSPAPGIVEQFRFADFRPEILFDSGNQDAARAAGEMLRSLSGLPARGSTAYVVVGGDGFMLECVRKYWRERKPFFGINTGQRGALMNRLLPAQLNPEFFRQPFQIGHARLLHAEVELAEGGTQTAYALNDAWLERASGQTGWFNLSINGEAGIDHLEGDSLLVCSPAGSTAYWRNMGGPPFNWDSAQLGLYGLGMDRDANFSPVLLRDTDVVAITNLDPAKRPLRACVDSREIGLARKMTIRVSRIAAVELVFLPQTIQQRTYRAALPGR